MFLAGYLQALEARQAADLLPEDRSQLSELLEIFLLERGLQSLSWILPEVRLGRMPEGELESRLRAMLMIAAEAITL